MELRQRLEAAEQLVHEKKNDEAMAELDNIIGEYGASPTLICLRALLLQAMASGQACPETRDMLEGILKTTPDYTPAMIELHSWHKAYGDQEEARKYLVMAQQFISAQFREVTQKTVESVVDSLPGSLADVMKNMAAGGLTIPNPPDDEEEVHQPDSIDDLDLSALAEDIPPRPAGAVVGGIGDDGKLPEFKEKKKTKRRKKDTE